MIYAACKKTELAELIGILLGDGNLNKISNCITIVGSLEDIYYYENHVIPLFQKIFRKTPKIRKRNDRKAYYLDLCCKDIMNYLSINVGLVRGNKVNAQIPKIVKNDKRLIPFFLRGLFDTDGCLKFSKQTADNNYYPRIQFCFRDTKFAHEVKGLIKQINFQSSSWKEKRGNGLIYFQISGKKNLIRWFDEIEPFNPVHISKFLFWKKFGYYIPKSTLSNRLHTLNLKMEEIFPK